MDDFRGWEELVDRVADARRRARESAPRTSNDHIEAGMFVAMCRAIEGFFQAQRDQAETPPAPVQETPPSPSEAPSETPPEAPPEVVVDDSEQEPTQEKEPTDAASDTVPTPEPGDPFDGLGAAGHGGAGDQSQ